MCITQILLGQGTPYNSSLLDHVHGYCKYLSSFQQILPLKWFKTSKGGGYPIYDIVEMCVPNSPLFQPPKIYDNPPPFFKKKVYEWPAFWNWNGPHFLTPTYIVIPVAITAIYLSKQGVSDLGYTRAHVSFRLETFLL